MTGLEKYSMIQGSFKCPLEINNQELKAKAVSTVLFSSHIQPYRSKHKVNLQLDK